MLYFGNVADLYFKFLSSSACFSGYKKGMRPTLRTLKLPINKVNQSQTSMRA